MAKCFLMVLSGPTGTVKASIVGRTQIVLDKPNEQKPLATTWSSSVAVLFSHDTTKLDDELACGAEPKCCELLFT